jgi:hypothetical protein
VFVPIAYASGFFDSYVLPEPRYRIPAFCRVIPGLGAMALGTASLVRTVGVLENQKL